jgi:type IV pilus assembly protein PilQ
MNANQPLTYTAVKHQFPLGVVLYFPDTSLKGIEENYTPSNSLVSAIQTSTLKRTRPSSRVEIRLNKDAPYRVTRVANQVVVAFSKHEKKAKVASQNSKTEQAVQTPAPKKSVATKPAPPVSQPVVSSKKKVSTPAVKTNKPFAVKTDKPAVLSRIDFEVTGGGKSRVTVETDRKVRYETKKISDKKLLLKLFATTIPKFQKRPLITTRFESAVDRVVPIQTKGMGDTAVIAVELREAIPYRVYQDKNICIVDLEASSVPPKPMPEAEKAAWIQAMKQTVKEAQAAVVSPVDKKAPAEAVTTEDGKVYSGQKISLDFQDADIHNIFRILHEVSGKNFVIGDDVKGRVTLKLVNVPWDQVLDLILNMNKLDTVTEGQVVRIATLSTLEAESVAMAKKKKAQETAKELEPLITEYIKLNYADAATISTHVNEVKSARGKVTIDQGTNMIIIKDEKESLEDAKVLIATIDEATQEIATRQVMIEARIVEADSSFTRDLGVQWGGDYSSGGGRSTTNLWGSQGTGQSSTSPNFAVNLPPSSVTSGLGFNFGWIAGATWNIEVRLLAMENQGKGRTISSPKVLTLDNKEATIKQISKIPYQVIEDNTTSIKTEEAGIILSVTPQITRDNRIRMVIHAEKGAPDWSNTVAGNPAIDTNTADTELFVNDGQTIVIGGVLSTDDTLNEARTPFMHNLPVLGWLFKQQQTVRNKDELLIFITPTIVKLEEVAKGS